MKIECVYHCRFCASSFSDIVETDKDEELEPIFMFLSREEFMFTPHSCEEGPSDFAKRMKGVIGVGYLTGFRVLEGKNAESIHSDNKG